MAQLSDKAPDVLPRSELNPLTNPALERNLGRWAEVYFGTPPGKRDQAINEYQEFLSHFQTSQTRLAQVGEARTALKRMMQ